MAGWFEFRTLNDLFGKLRREQARLEADPLNADVAFNFFVTANCLPDWEFPGGARGSPQERARSRRRHGHPALATCAHLADGSKHLQVSNPRHTSVLGTASRRHGYWGGGYLGAYYGQYFGPRELVIQLDGQARAMYGDIISVIDLAQAVVVQWDRILYP